MDPADNLRKDFYSSPVEAFLAPIEARTSSTSHAFEVQVVKCAVDVNVDIPNHTVSVLLHQVIQLLGIAIDDDLRLM